jgi:RNA polymerase-binding transcription factor DksA
MQKSKFKDHLLAMKKDLTERVAKISRDLHTPLENDWEERAIQMENDEVLVGLGAEGNVELSQINLALERIERGTFGTCIKCRKEISEGRLHALPFAAVCSPCANKKEKAGV